VLVLALALLAAVFSAVERVLHRSNLADRGDTYGYTVCFQLACAALSLPLVVASVPRMPGIAPRSLIFLAAAAACWVGFSLLTFRADSLVEASVKSAVSRLRVVWTLALGALVFGEDVGGLRILGAALIAASPLLLLRASPTVSVRGVVLEAGATVFLAGALLFDKLAMETIPPGVVTFLAFANAAVFLLVAGRLTARRRGATLHGVWVLDTALTRRVGVTAVTSVACYYLLMLALRAGEFSLVLPVYMLSPVLVLVLAYAFLGERGELRLKVVVVGLSTLGAMLTVVS